MNNKNSTSVVLVLTLIIGLSNLFFPPVIADYTALDMLFEIETFDLSADLYTYSEYVTMLDDIGVVPSDFILGEEPVAIILASYQKEDAYVWLEILEFESVSDANNEYALQAEDIEYISGLGYQGNNGPLYQRFIPRERVFVHDRFLFLLFYSPLDNPDAYDYMDDLLPIIISNILDTIGIFSPEPPDYTVDATWGLKVGDYVSWSVSDSTFTGSLGTGTSSSQGEWEVGFEVIDIKNGHLLIKQRSKIHHILTEDETRVPVNIPYDRYTWLSPDEEGASIESDDGSSSEIVLYPMELNGVPLIDLVYNSIEHLPERDISETQEYVSVHGNTRSYSGFTPIETSWKDITVHKGTGIVTSSDFYYNNNEYSITTSVGVTLDYTSFELRSRLPVILSLTVSSTISDSTINEGDSVTVNAHVTDQDGEAVTDAEIRGTFNEKNFTLIHKDQGRYESTLSTEEFIEGIYNITIRVEKEGYQSITDTNTIEVKKEQISQTDNGSSNSTGIPGFQFQSIVLGFILSIILISILNIRR
jgi:hypothetical protein